MHQFFRDFAMLAICIASMTATGCALPVSDHPLSDDTTSVIDEQLIGYWMYIPKDREEQKPPAPHVIGRVLDKPNRLEVVYTELDGDGHVKVHRLPAYSTTLDDRHYLSLTSENDGKPQYLVLLYKIGDDDTLRLYILNENVIGPAIEQGRLAGVVERNNPPPAEECTKPVEPNYKKIHITATPKQLAAFLKEKGAACHKMDQPLTFKRVPTE
jgi:hypothetical protein